MLIVATRPMFVSGHACALPDAHSVALIGCLRRLFSPKAVNKRLHGGKLPSVAGASRNHNLVFYVHSALLPESDALRGAAIAGRAPFFYKEKMKALSTLEESSTVRCAQRGSCTHKEFMG